MTGEPIDIGGGVMYIPGGRRSSIDDEIEAAKQAYADGRIEIAELERRIDAAIRGQL